ncbi:hypothetical protein ACRRTK_015270 [Alexandromys fortis]
MTPASRPWWLVPWSPLLASLAPRSPTSPHPAGQLCFRPPGPVIPPRLGLGTHARRSPPPPPPLPCLSSRGRALGRAGAASAPLPRPGWPREEVPLSVSGEGRPGRPEGAAPRTGSAGRWEALAEGRAGERGREGGGSGPYKRRGQGGREASVRPMCRPPGAGVGAARAMRAGWVGGRRGAKRSRLGA